jgi:hypothetical protein
MRNGSQQSQLAERDSHPDHRSILLFQPQGICKSSELSQRNMPVASVERA